MTKHWRPLARNAYYTYSHKGRSLIYLVLKRYDEPLADLIKTLEIAPNDANGYRKLSRNSNGFGASESNAKIKMRSY